MKYLALAAYIAGAAALGINCRGSSFCGDNAPPMQNIKNELGYMIDNGLGGKYYHENDQIVCSQVESLSSCVFFQKGASGTVQDAYNHVERLMDHGCYNCGSDPTQPGNDVNRGELTVNVVSSPCCGGDCRC
ncbi:hypothetical protein SEPCBS119000_006503 [Sporothrix epigloea]|uniref:Killer toxin Kp4 domain-containing protein n=1 Tax=Sporothrix epigloea TaxID=1892477 RepID=A0ABP0E3D6_9PEZI